MADLVVSANIDTLMQSANFAAARTNQGVGTADSPQFAAVNIGAATDTTVARTSAGVINVEGKDVYMVGGADVAVGDGGTGASTLAAHGVLVGNGTSAVSVTGTGTAGQVLTSNGASADPTFQDAGGGTTGSNTQDTFTGDGSTTVFTLSASPASNKAVVSVNGVVQTPTADYSISGTTLTFTTAPANTLKVIAFYSAPAGGGGTGTVTSITAGTGLSGGTITTSGTIAIDSTVATLTGSQSLTNKKLGSLTTNGLVTTSSGDGTLSVTAPGTGVLTALAVNVGSAGAFVTFNGAGGTPSSLNLSNATVDGTNLVGYRGAPQNSQSAAYTTVLTDAGKCIFHPAADNNARTFTIDSNANVAYVVGTIIEFLNMAAANVTIAITSDTMTLLPAGTTGSRTLAQYGRASAEKISSTAWVISGNSALT